MVLMADGQNKYVSHCTGSQNIGIAQLILSILLKCMAQTEQYIVYNIILYATVT